ncbi:hypothetical protein [Rhizobium halophilum]|uniref:hypothetical protein n=1 Tax=Rhizobium halophilum TaxID=2846852 RepID=UPI001EFE2503|nr:hypothetical protein [Rhizobium halophilum]MCF6368340.1 hypothetical protein [Rhizobium halophilum]
MSIDKATIINQALTAIGAGPMFSTDDDSDLAETIAATWPAVVDQVFGMHDWSFSLKTYKNTRNAEQPENGYRYGFDLPGNRIGNPILNMSEPRSRRPLRDFSIEEGKLFCDEAQTWSLVKVAVDPDIWPPQFRSAFRIALGAYLAVPVWQDTSMQDEMLVQAFGTASREGTGGLFGRLMAQDSASQPKGLGIANEDPLTDARISGAGPLSSPWYGSL